MKSSSSTKVSTALGSPGNARLASACSRPYSPWSTAS